MILTVLFLTLVLSCFAQPADNNEQQRSSRAPQGQIQYTRPDGLKVDWKQYLPSTSPATRSQRAETGTGHHNTNQSPIMHQHEYKPYSAVPSHIKQLIVQAYSPQGPYVDPGAFFYQASANQHLASSAAPQENNHQGSSTTVTQVPIEQSYFNSAVNFRSAGFAEQQNQQQIGTNAKLLGGIKYKDEDRVYQRSAELPYGSVLMSSQTQTKQQYQPYKQIQQSQLQRYNNMPSISQNQQYNNMPSTKQYQLYNNNQYSQHQNQGYNKPQPLFHYEQQNKPQQQQNQYKQDTQSQLYKQNPNQSSIKTSDLQTNYDQNMPNAIQTLLNYQSQLPYNVIANHILYRPKQIFIPKPLPESAKIARQYPSKIYFVKSDGEIYDSPDTNENGKQGKSY